MTAFLYVRRSFSVTNKKGKEFQIWFQQFNHTLFLNEVSMDAFFAEVERVIHKLNEKYPRSAKLCCPRFRNSPKVACFHVYPEEHPEKVVTEFMIRRVSVLYGYGEPTEVKALMEKGGEA